MSKVGTKSLKPEDELDGFEEPELEGGATKSVWMAACTSKIGAPSVLGGAVVSVSRSLAFN